MLPEPAGEPSPKFQLKVGEPTPPEVVAEKLTEIPTSVRLGVPVAVETWRREATIRVRDLVAVTLLASVTVKVTVKLPPALA